MSTRIHYITSWYGDVVLSRRHELAAAISQQLADPLVESVCLESPRMGRPTFGEMVARGRSEPWYVNLLLNTDCFVDPDDTKLFDLIKDDEVWCISRMDNCHACSQDAWAWRGTLVLPTANYPQGVPGCDNRMAYDVARAGRIPINPARTIRVHHVHSSGRRSYTERDRVPPPYLWVDPVQLGVATRVGFRGADCDLKEIAHLKDFMTEIQV